MIRPFELAALAVALVVGLAGARWMDAGHLFLACEVLTLFLMAQMWNLLAGYGGCRWAIRCSSGWAPMRCS